MLIRGSLRFFHQLGRLDWRRRWSQPGFKKRARALGGKIVSPKPLLFPRGSAKSLTKSLTCADAAGETLQSATDVLVSFTEGQSGAR
jgi:hypothetical protein